MRRKTILMLWLYQGDMRDIDWDQFAYLSVESAMVISWVAKIREIVNR